MNDNEGNFKLFTTTLILYPTQKLLPSFKIACSVCPWIYFQPSLTVASFKNTKGGSITVPLTFCLTGLDYTVLQI